MNRVKLYVQKDGKEEEILFEVRRMVNAGYTGRNQQAVRSHIEELKRDKIPAPDSIPTAYEVISKHLYFDDEIEVVGEKTSGEAEFALLCSGTRVFVGVGSDHTDRELEAVSVIKSKQVCPNVMSRCVWDLNDVQKDWDEIILRSWVKDDRGDKLIYQEAPLTTILSPEDLMNFVRNKLNDKELDGVAIFSGTVAIIPEKINFGSYFEAELHHPGTGKRLGCAYRVNVLNYLRA